jgi:hypothetical protein
MPRSFLVTLSYNLISLCINDMPVILTERFFPADGGRGYDYVAGLARVFGGAFGSLKSGIRLISL